MRNLKTIFESIKAFLHLGYTLLFFFNNPEKLHNEGIRLKNYFERIGGIFIKFGQMLALRVDILPEGICRELRNLLDNVTPFEYAQAEKMFEEEFNRTISKVFQKFEKKTIASASLGQVYRAKLKTGELVAVKIRRPKIEELAKSDIKLITKISKIIDTIPLMPFKLTPVVKEFSSWVFEELDYKNELNNLEEFSKFKSEILPFFNVPLKINLPKVYPQYSGKNILTMEFIEGVSVNKLIELKNSKDQTEFRKLLKEGYNIKQILKNINLMQLKQIYIDGYFNADPHPANIIIKSNNQVYYVDFGLVGKLTDRQKAAVSKFLRSSSILDWRSAFQAAIIMFEVNDERKINQLREEIKKMFNYLKKQRITYNTYSKASTDSILYFSKLIYILKLPIPIDISKALRCVMTSDSIVHNLAPEASVEEITQDLFKVTLAATFLGLKKKMNKDSILKLAIKAINFVESEILLED